MWSRWLVHTNTQNKIYIYINMYIIHVRTQDTQIQFASNADALEIILQQFIQTCRKERHHLSRMHCLVSRPVGTCLPFVQTVPKANYVSWSDAKLCFAASSGPKPSRKITILNVFCGLKEKVSPQELLGQMRVDDLAQRFSLSLGPMEVSITGFQELHRFAQP